MSEIKFTYLFTHLLTYLLTYLLTFLLTYLLTYLLACFLTYFLIYLLTYFYYCSWSGFDLMTCDLYFTILVEVFMNHILAWKMYFTNCIEQREHKIMVLKPANKCQIIQHCHNSKKILINYFHHHPFLFQAKVLWTLFLWDRISKLKRQDSYLFIKHLFIFWFILEPEKYFMKLFNRENWFVL